MYGYQVDEKKMLEQAIHFKEESDALYKLLINADKNSFKLKTQFKSWTINDVLYHLHVWNIAALLSLKNENEFKEFMQNFMEAVKSGNSAREYEKILSDNTEGLDLLNLWKETYEKISNEFAKSDPKKRVKWAGPDMSVRSSITARHMETWAHGQEIFDQLGFERIDTDRIKNKAKVPKASVVMEMIDKKLIIVLFFLERKYLRAMKNGRFKMYVYSLF